VVKIQLACLVSLTNLGTHPNAAQWYLVET
jgi:hypothetical protein